MEQKKRKPTKTISGVAPISVMLPPRRCEHGACLYCPTLDAPQSYTPESPAVIRARQCEYDPFKQIQKRIKTLEIMGHPVDKVELIIMGGTFISYPRDFRYDFVKQCYEALNNKRSKTLEEAKKLNETAKRRCIALCVETRPDQCSDEDVQDILSYGATRVELGVQIIDDTIYKKIHRCHDVQAVADATRRLKMAGFKIGYHIMPGLPFSNPTKDVTLFKKLFSFQDFKPDQVKIYPCQVLKGAGLANLYYGGEYVPYTKEVARDVIINMMKNTPRYCRIMRIMREIPPAYLIAGIKHLDMRKDIEDEIRERKISIQEIRFREIGFVLRDKRKLNTDIEIKVTKYKASEGIEYFLEAVNCDDVLFGLLRLRLEKNKDIPAMIRELHVYGPTLKLGEKANKEWQHKGLGKELISKAEEIAKKDKRKDIRIISGIGVREYYKKLGYETDAKGIYVEKKLDL